MFRDWSSPEAVFQILKRLSRGRPFDITGIEDYAMLDRHGGVQWPFAEGTLLETREEHERRLFEDGRYFTPDGRAKFLYTQPKPLPEGCTPAYPLILLTGRGSSSQWHTQTRTRHSSVLARLSPSELYVEISPEDAQRYGVSPDELVSVASQRASVQARTFVTHTVKAGHVFMPMHYPTMNQLTFAAFDPYSRQPAYKACAVRIERLAPT
jgi:assimilatory nitrate reductase catalytic subunit